MTLINVFAGVFSLPVLLFSGLPDPVSWPFSALSLAIHIAYTFALSAAYKHADLSVVYPIARGGAPLLTAFISLIFFNEPISTTSLAGIGIVAAGIMLMTLRPAQPRHAADYKGIAFALLTAVLICCYTLSDGMGARASGNAVAYTALLFVLNAFVPLPLIYALRGRDAFSPVRNFIWQGVVGGAMGLVSYAIAIWAMTVAPIPLVAAVRETSVLFAAGIAVVFLREPMRWNRVAAALLILSGLILIRL